MSDSKSTHTQDAEQDSPQDRIRERWLAAMRSFQSGLPQPVAIAMVDAAAKGFVGEQLQKIEQGLMCLDHAGLDDLTGSEARVLVAILRQMHDELEQLEDKLQSLWEKR